MNEPNPMPPTLFGPGTQAGSAAVGATATSSVERYGRFAVQRLLAQGGLGEVYVAEDEELRRTVAFKRMRPEKAQDEELRRRFLYEAEVTARLEHPGIVPIYGLVQGPDGQPYYAMRFIEGDSLAAAIARYHGPRNRVSGRNRVSDESTGRLAFRTLLSNFVAVCKTMAYAHSRNVIHRDLKPANVLLGKFGETLVVDWGVAKDVREIESESVREPTAEGGAPALLPPNLLTQAGKALGTPAYMSPEQAAGRWDLVGPRSDIYSLGVILYELLTGRRPIDCQNVLEMLQKVQAGDFSPPRQVNPEAPKPLEAICLKAMAAKPEDRYASAGELAADVEHWLADEPVSAYAERWPIRFGRWMRRHRAIVTGGVAAIVVAAACLGALAWVVDGKNSKLREERDRADQERDRANDGFAHAQQAVEIFFTTVTEDAKLKQVDLFDLRKKLLETAVPFCNWLKQQQRDTPQAREAVGRAYWRLGLIRSEMGEKAEATADYRQMQTIFEELTAQFPGVAEYQHGLVAGHVNLGAQYQDVGQWTEAEQHYRKALAVEEQLAADFPTPVYLQDLARCHTNLAKLYKDWGQPAAAEQSFRRALAIRKKLADEIPEAPGNRFELAANLNGLGTALVAEAQWPAAEQAFRQAVAIQEKLVADFPTGVQNRRELALSRANLGMLLKDTNQYAGAEEVHRQALEMQEKLTADFPTVPQYRQDLARTQNSLGRLLQNMRRPGDAEQAFRRAIDVQNKLALDFPNVPYFRMDLGQSYNNLGILQMTLRQRPAAEQTFRRAFDIQEKLIAAFPTVPQYRTDLAGSYVNFGQLLRNQGEAQESLGWFAKAIALLGPLVEQNSRLATGRLFLRNAHLSRAEALDKLGRFADAVKDWDTALMLNADPTLAAEFRRQRAYSLARGGEHANAMAEVNAAVEGKDVTGVAFYDLACISALSSAAVKDDAKLQDQYALRAVELLRQAIVKGYKDIEHLKKDDDLKALREREDYKKLVKELETSAKPATEKGQP